MGPMGIHAPQVFLVAGAAPCRRRAAAAARQRLQGRGKPRSGGLGFYDGTVPNMGLYIITGSIPCTCAGQFRQGARNEPSSEHFLPSSSLVYG